MGQSQYQKDFDFYWRTVNDNFAYFHKRKTDWEKVKVIYQPEVDTIKSRDGFVHLLEKANNELYNGHVFLNTNTNSSNRLIPSGADLKVAVIDKQFVVNEVRTGYNSDLAGIRKGMRIIKYNGIPIRSAIEGLLPKSTKNINDEMLEYAANMLLAGTHDKSRVITAIVNGREQDIMPDAVANRSDQHTDLLLESQRLGGNIGYIKVNNSLGDTDLIKKFDDAVDGLIDSSGLILDLRETPGGGNTTVARAIMGRFVEKELAYQKHIYTDEEKQTGIKRTTLEIVSPRGKIYKKPMIVLVGYWTGSMGEGLAIGFDAMKRAKIAGTLMAGLLGEIYTFEMPETKIPFSFPCVQLQHVNGLPREDFKPWIYIQDQKTAVEYVSELLKNTKKRGK